MKKLTVLLAVIMLISAFMGKDFTFVGEEYVLVFVDYVQPGSGDLQIGIFLLGLFKKLIVDV